MQKAVALSIYIGISMCPSVSSGQVIPDIDTLHIYTAEGTAPQLPYQILVTYADGKKEWRKIRWTNAALATEQREANPKVYPAGSKYTVKGYVSGSDATPQGYPVTAHVTVTDNSGIHNYATKHAYPLPLQDVAIDGNNRLTSNRNIDIDALLALDITQQLYNYRDTYGLPTKDYTKADGWDDPTIKLKGHGSGHYMSALALAFASCQDSHKKSLLRQRMKRMVDELRACQERTFTWSDSLGRYFEARDLAPEKELLEMKATWNDFDKYKQDYSHYGYGYINAIPPQHPVLTEAYRPYNNEQWLWAPYYSIHKQLAGLVDIARYTDDKKTAQKAVQTARDMGLWVWNRLHYRTFVKIDGSRQERRSKPGNRYEMWNMYIAGEVGGMAESLARLAEMTADTACSRKLLEAAQCFDAPAFYDPLARNIDDIRGRHANQHIPMITGALRIYSLCGNPYYYNVAQNFWALVQGRYRYAPGGVGNGEMFRQPYAQMTSMLANFTTDSQGNRKEEPTMNETCCAYNLAKLTKDLNCFNPDDARYMDYYERVLYNQIVGSVNPHHYQTTYQYAVGMNASKPWGNETPQSTCCGGTGAENHVKYQEAAYFANDSTLWVALYLPSTAHWRSKGITFRQSCSWPAEHSTIRIIKGCAPFSMKLRIPSWATQDVSIKLNGIEVASSYYPCSYVEIPRRKWNKNDVIEISMPYSIYIDYAPDKVDGKWAGTLMYGPLAMTTTGINCWSNAVTDRQLNNVKVNKPTADEGTDGNLYTLEWDNRHFIPDYYADHGITHYLLLQPSEKEIDARFSTDVDNSKFLEMKDLAANRIAEQEAWLQMNNKVPEYSPWAPHAFNRMKVAYDSIQTGIPATQADVDRMAEQLGTLLNAMRPGNLPEPEDLQPLLFELKRAKALPQASTTEGKKNIDYAEMVVKYVSDGSGTTDMIAKAISLLKTL